MCKNRSTGQDDRHRGVKRDVSKQLKLQLGDRDSSAKISDILNENLSATTGKGRFETTKSSTRGYSSVKFWTFLSKSLSKTLKIRMLWKNGNLYQGILLGGKFGPPRRNSSKTPKIRIFWKNGQFHQGILLGENFGPPRRKFVKNA